MSCKRHVAQMVLILAVSSIGSWDVLSAGAATGSAAGKEPSKILKSQPYETVRRADLLAGHGKIVSAVAVLRKTMAGYPDYLAAHAEYVKIRTFHQQDYDAVRREYDSLMARDPANPIYPLALSFGAQGLIPGRTRRQWLERIARL